MKITTLVWDENNVDHIARHQVEPEEVEEVCYSNPLILRAGKKKQKLYYILGQSQNGRYLFIVARYIGKGQARVITARDMNNSERTRFGRRCK